MSWSFETQMGDGSIHLDGAQNIAEAKLGAVSKVSSRVNVWGEVSQQRGSNDYRDRAFTLGLKVNV